MDKGLSEVKLEFIELCPAEWSYRYLHSRRRTILCVTWYKSSYVIK
jgi:hypothetical protein